MARINPQDQSERENYMLLTSSIVPRPIAFVTSLSKHDNINAAPFSYFNIVSADPPLISISVQRKKDGMHKDTAYNIQNKEQFVVHITDENNINDINQTSMNLPPDQSELNFTHLTTIPSEEISVPGIKEAAIRMECVLEKMISLGGTNGSPACDLIIGKVVCFHISDSIFVDGVIISEALNPVSRLGGNQYSKLGEVFSLDRP